VRITENVGFILLPVKPMLIGNANVVNGKKIPIFYCVLYIAKSLRKR
jgi:hypothetical protein